MTWRQKLRSLTAIAVGSSMLLLAGCTTYYRNYSNPNADFHRDLYECRRENSHPAAAVAGQYGSAVIQVNESMALQCMAARGWREVSGSEVAPSAPPSSSRPADTPVCGVGKYWSSAKRECVKIGE